MILSAAESVNAVIADTCVLSGDSGGAALIGDYAAGITSGSTAIQGACTARRRQRLLPRRVARSDPTCSTSTATGSSSVAVSTPQITSILGGRSYVDVPVRGTVPNAPAGTLVSLYLDGATTPRSTFTLTSRGGSFSLPFGVGLARVAHLAGRRVPGRRSRARRRAARSPWSHDPRPIVSSARAGTRPRSRPRVAAFPTPGGRPGRLPRLGRGLRRRPQRRSGGGEGRRSAAVDAALRPDVRDPRRDPSPEPRRDRDRGWPRRCRGIRRRNPARHRTRCTASAASIATTRVASS